MVGAVFIDPGAAMARTTLTILAAALVSRGVHGLSIASASANGVASKALPAKWFGGTPGPRSILDQAAAFHSQGGVVLRQGLPDQVVARSLLTLDTNHDGCIDPREVTAFATAQGLDAASASREFTSFDTNGDGVLDSKEIAAALGVVSPSSLSPAPLDSWGARAEDSSAADGLQGQSPASLQILASTLVKQLALQAAAENEAQALEHRSADLRANATALAREAKEQAILVADQAAKAKAAELLKTILELDERAKEAEVEAASLRAKTQAEQVQGDGLMAVADDALRLQGDL